MSGAVHYSDQWKATIAKWHNCACAMQHATSTIHYFILVRDNKLLAWLAGRLASRGWPWEAGPAPPPACRWSTGTRWPSGSCSEHIVLARTIQAFKSLNYHPPTNQPSVTSGGRRPGRPSTHPTPPRAGRRSRWGGWPGRCSSCPRRWSAGPKERRLQLCECGNRTVIVNTGGGTIVMCVCIGITMFLQNDRGNVRMWFMDVVRPKWLCLSVYCECGQTQMVCLNLDYGCGQTLMVCLSVDYGYGQPQVLCAAVSVIVVRPEG